MLDVAPIETPLETKSADTPAATQPKRPTRYRPRRTTADRLRQALLSLAGESALILTHDESAWTSITFTGTRHEIVLEFDGREAVEAGELFIADLPDHEFDIPRQLVADASIREVDHHFGVSERMMVTCVLLLLEEV